MTLSPPLPIFNTNEFCNIFRIFLQNAWGHFKRIHYFKNFTLRNVHPGVLFYVLCFTLLFYVKCLAYYILSVSENAT